MIQIRSEAAIGTCFLIALATAPAARVQNSAPAGPKFVICDEATMSTHASGVTVQISDLAPAIAHDLLPYVAFAIAKREVALPADIAAVISKNLQNYWD